MVLRTTGERVSVLVQACPAVTGSLGPESLHRLGSIGVERQVAEPRSAAVVIAVQRRRFEDDVQRAEPPAPAVLPALERLVAEFAEQPALHPGGGVEVGGAELDVVQRAERHRSFRRVFVLRVVVVRLKRAAAARLANIVSVLDPFGHDQ